MTGVAADALHMVLTSSASYVTAAAHEMEMCVLSLEKGFSSRRESSMDQSPSIPVKKM